MLGDGLDKRVKRVGKQVTVLAQGCAVRARRTRLSCETHSFDDGVNSVRQNARSRKRKEPQYIQEVIPSDEEVLEEGKDQRIVAGVLFFYLGKRAKRRPLPEA